MIYKNIIQIGDDGEDCDFFIATLHADSRADCKCLQNPAEALKKLIQQKLLPDFAS